MADLAPVLARRAIELTLAGDTSLMRSILERKPGKFRQQLSAEARYGLIMQSGPLAGRVIVIERPILRIGRRSTNDVVIPDPTVSRQHARLEQARAGLVLIDENSCNGTFVNGCRITNSTVLRPDDIVRFGTSHCRVWRIPPRQEGYYGLIMQSGPLAGRVIVIERPILRIGRRSTNDVVIPDPTVSRQHARLFQARAGLVLIDENSCNGTFVNGCRITNSTVLRPDDIVRFGTSHCRVWRIPPRQDVTQCSVVVPSGAGIVAGRVPAEGEDVTRYPVAVPSAAGRDTLCIAARIALVDSVQRLHEAERHAINV
jgi:pSer/pThr/pTyr-binding forkhead associated (FHA) protein